MKIEAGTTFVLLSRIRKGPRKFLGLYLARKLIDTEQLPQKSAADLETYLREEGFIQNVEFEYKVLTFLENQCQAA